MFVKLENGTYVSKDIIGSITLHKRNFPSAEKTNLRYVAKLKDKRGQHLGEINTPHVFGNFWDQEETTIIPAQSGYTCINSERHGDNDSEFVIHTSGPVIAWRIAVGDSDIFPPVPIGMFGDEEGAIAPDGKVLFRDGLHDSLDALKSSLARGAV